MHVMRFTIVDARGAISFVAPCEALGALVAACAENPTTHEALLECAGRFSPQLESYVLNGLAVFDEHNAEDAYDAIRSALRHLQPHEVPPFRVVDEETRRASLEPVKAGVVLFNLLDRRIVQVQNSYSEIRRRGRVRVYRGPRWGGEMHRYELPSSWDIVP
jgi:hypothetical protein